MVYADGVAVIGHLVRIGLTLAQAHRAPAAVAAEIDDALPALAGDVPFVHVAQRPEQPAVEGQAALERADDEIEVVDGLHAAVRLGRLQGCRAE